MDILTSVSAVLSVLFSSDLHTQIFYLLLLGFFSNSEGISFVNPKISFVSLVFFPFEHFVVRCQTCGTSLCSLISSSFPCTAALRHPYTSSCLSLWNTFFLYLSSVSHILCPTTHTHIYPSFLHARTVCLKSAQEAVRNTHCLVCWSGQASCFHSLYRGAHLSSD